MKLSIITVCLNIKDEVNRTCTSIAHQTERNFEWIVIDGGSTDGTIDVLKKYQDHITHLVSEKDTGIYQAMNKGIRLAKGEWVILMNGGDHFYSTDVVEKFYDFLESDVNKDDSVIFGNTIRDNLTLLSRELAFPEEATFFINDNIEHQSSFIKRNLFDKYGFYEESYKIVSDWEKWIIFSKEGEKFRFIPLIVSSFYTNGISHNNEPLKLREISSVFQKTFSDSEIKENRKMTYINWFGRGLKVPKRSKNFIMNIPYDIAKLFILNYKKLKNLLKLSALVSNMRFIIRLRNKYQKVISLKTTRPYVGKALVSYVKLPALLMSKDDSDLFFHNHSNVWECREIIKAFLGMGYDVDVIDYHNHKVANKKYDVIFYIEDIPAYLDSPIKILYATGSYSSSAEAQETRRIEEVNAKYHSSLVPVRTSSKTSQKLDEGLQKASHLVLIGNDTTKNTFPAQYRDNISLINPTPSYPLPVKKSLYTPKEREFLYYAGSGAVLKGLDLTLEVFAKHPEWTLNVVSMLAFSESDFFELFSDILSLPNIHYYGKLNPSSQKFAEICSRCFCYISASSSEGVSTSALTAISVGLYPIITLNNGIDLPNGLGLYIETSTSSIEEAIVKTLGMTDEMLDYDIRKIQYHFLATYNRKNFTKDIKNILNKIIND